MGHCSVGKVFNRTNVKYANVQLIIGQLTDCSIGILFEELMFNLDLFK